MKKLKSIIGFCFILIAANLSASNLEPILGTVNRIVPWILITIWRYSKSVRKMGNY